MNIKNLIIVVRTEDGTGVVTETVKTDYELPELKQKLMDILRWLDEGDPLAVAARVPVPNRPRTHASAVQHHYEMESWKVG